MCAPGKGLPGARLASRRVFAGPGAWQGLPPGGHDRGRDARRRRDRIGGHPRSRETPATAAFRRGGIHWSGDCALCGHGAVSKHPAGDWCGETITVSIAARGNSGTGAGSGDALCPGMFRIIPVCREASGSSAMAVPGIPCPAFRRQAAGLGDSRESRPRHMVLRRSVPEMPLPAGIPLRGAALPSLARRELPGRYGAAGGGGLSPDPSPSPCPASRAGGWRCARIRSCLRRPCRAARARPPPRRPA